MPTNTLLPTENTISEDACKFAYDYFAPYVELAKNGKLALLWKIFLKTAVVEKIAAHAVHQRWMSLLQLLTVSVTLL